MKNFPRVVASMTTIPSRIRFIRPAIEAVLAQTVPVVHIELNIPHISKRTGELYELPDWLIGLERTKIYRTDDYGPITKVAPTLLRYKTDQETYIWSVDDDCAYPTNQLELLCTVHDPSKRRILTRYGGELKSDGTVQFWYGEGEVTMFEGFGGVLYPPGCIGDDFQTYLDFTSANEYCRKNDDIVLAMYFAHNQIPMYLYNRPSDDVPYMVTGWIDDANLNPLSVSGWEDIYKKIFAFIKSNWPAGTMLQNDRMCDVTSDLRATLNHLRPHTVQEFQKFRAGASADGGYVMLDALHVGQIGYSIGIGGDVSWDIEMGERGLLIFQYDHTVDGPPATHPNFRFHKTELAVTDGNEKLSLLSAIHANGHVAHDDMILKMDIEGAEWEILDTISNDILARFTQILLEIHDLGRLEEPDWRARANRVFAKIGATHACIHVHGNNWGRLCVVGGIPLPDVLELSFARRDIGTIVPSDELFPTSLDFPNNPRNHDFFLGGFRFL